MELISPTEGQLKRICNEINLRKAQHKRDTEALHQWLLTQPHLPHDLEYNILASFIMGSKNSIERSKQLLDSYLTNRTSCPDFFANRDPCDPAIVKHSKLVQTFVLPRMTLEGYRVTIFRIASPDVDSADISLKLNAIQALSSFDVRLLEDVYWAGDILIVDLIHGSIKHFRALSIPVLQQYIRCFVVI